MNRSVSTATLLIISVLLAGCDLIGDKAEEVLVDAGTKANVDVSVDAVEISALGGSGSIAGLSIRNPEGYQTEFAFVMERIALDIRVSSVLFKPVTLNEFVLDSPVVNLEVKGPGENNLKEIADRFTSAFEKAGPEAKGSEEAQDGETSAKEPEKALRLRIRDLRLEGVSFNFYPANGSPFSGTLPKVHLTDVGGNEGVTAQRLGAIIALTIGGRILVERFMDELKQRLLDENGFVTELRQFFVSINAEMPPGLQNAVRAYVEDLHRILEAASEQGFRDLEGTRVDISSANEDLVGALKADLDEEQVRQLREHLSANRDAIAESFKARIVEMIQQRLILRQDQLSATQDIIRDILEQIAGLVKRHRSGDLDHVDWEDEYVQLVDSSLPRLGEVLDDTQMASYTVWAAQVDRFIRANLLTTKPE